MVRLFRDLPLNVPRTVDLFSRRIGQILCGVILCPLCLVLSSAPLLCASFDLRIKEERLTGSTADYPLEQALKQLADQAGFEVKIFGPLNARVTCNLADSPLAVGLHRLVDNHSLVILFEQHGDRQFIKEVWLFPQQETRPSGIAPGAVMEPREYVPATPLHRESELADSSGEDPGDPADADLVRLQEVVSGGRDRDQLELAVRELAAFESAEAVQAMARVLARPDPALRRYVAQQLGRNLHDQAVMILGQIILGDQDPGVRLEAVKALAGKESVSARTFLRAATRDNNLSIRRAATEAL
ncbi:HEAT repeat domain-containing protein [Desulfogranum mediterraneum]|uniref:HEAT repeat domain-containing protein n=1 Tax=Desulfogranum mediterraneum TaxID=160661 RepID=UPI0003FA22FC|nr:HEAT repeat domain-containing protein [Desulfogranum mediterraneum]